MSPHVCRGCGRMMLMYEDGHPAVIIARELQTTLPSVYKHLRFHGVAIRPKGRFGVKPPPVWHGEAVALYQQGFTVSAIGRKTGRSQERVRQVLVRTLGVAYHPTYRQSHRCTDICVAVQTTEQPFQYLALARTLGVSYRKVERAARQHGIKALGNVHQCTSRCEAILAGLREGKSARSVAIGLGMGPHVANQFTTHLKSYHPDWPWFDARRLRNGGPRPGPRHVCGERCQNVRAGLDIGTPPSRTLQTVCGMNYDAAGNLAVRLKHHHPDWPWPQRRTIATAP